MGRVRKPHVLVDRSKRAQTHSTHTKDTIVVHCTQSKDRDGADDIVGVLKYLENKGYGVHYVVDGDGNIGKGAKHSDVVYHCLGENSHTIGIEMIGMAQWPTARWLYSRGTRKRYRKQIQTVAHLIAYISDQEGIPLKHDSPGVMRHMDYPAGGHTDPGKGFPFGYLMKHARRIKQEA